MIRASSFAGRAVAVFGLGASGTATVEALRAGGAHVAAWDDSEASRAAAARLGVPLVDLSRADWGAFAALVLSPGVPLTHPEPHWTVDLARAAGAQIIGDVELFAREREALAPEAPFVAITGTNGKSTTTALIAHILTELGCDVQLGGNIGRPILTLEPPARGRVHVIEMSSFQIELTPTLRPSVGVLLNITPDHLDRHGTLESYAAVKERLVATAEIACVGCDDELSRAIGSRRIAAGSPTILFGVGGEVGQGYALDGDRIVVRGGLACTPSPPPLWGREGGNPLQQPAGVPPPLTPPHQGEGEPREIVLARQGPLRTLRGQHNAQNALAAIAAVQALLGHAREIDWQSLLASFPGLPHRMEEVGRDGKVTFVNDSKATNADSAARALASWDGGIFWILGGQAKAGGITSLAPYFGRVTKAYLIGDATEAFAATLDGKVALERCGTLDRAVAAAARDASASAAPEPVVLLSPACASYDQFKNFEERGEAFRAAVAGLMQNEPSRRSAS